MESAEIISPLIALARLMERAVFPTEVGPVKIIKGFLFIVIT
jgi:hypothetical protein